MAAKQATATIPIVGGSLNIPVEVGLVSSLARPGGNVTGASQSWGPLVQKRIQLLLEIMPSLKRVGYFRNAGAADDAYFEGLARAASALGLTMVPVKFTQRADIDAAMAELISARVDAVHVGSASGNTAIYCERERLVELAHRARVPVITSIPAMAGSRALFSYGGSLDAKYRRAAQLLDKVLRGAKPADLPVEQSTEIEFIVNAKAARLLGITIPPAILLRADRVIE